MKLLALLMLLAGVTVPVPVSESEPYLVHWSDVDFVEGHGWVETESFDGEYATLWQARIIARAVARQHYMQESFAVDLAHFHNGRLVTYELFYTGGDHVIRIRDGRVLCQARCRPEGD